MKRLMKKIGELGYHVYVRYDPLRDHRMFTVMIDSEEKVPGTTMSSSTERYDTDNPRLYLRRTYQALKHGRHIIDFCRAIFGGNENDS